MYENFTSRKFTRIEKGRKFKKYKLVVWTSKVLWLATFVVRQFQWKKMLIYVNTLSLNKSTLFRLVTTAEDMFLVCITSQGNKSQWANIIIIEKKLIDANR